MRKQFVQTVEAIIKKNKNIFLILGDIGVFGFRNTFKNKKNQIINIGILEQATISFAAGLSKMGLIPIVHTIATFLVERAIEQIKIDFGYQKLGGNLVSVGASYDYASLGSTHHCPADINLIKNIPNAEIIVPGTHHSLIYYLDQIMQKSSSTKLIFNLLKYSFFEKLSINLPRLSIKNFGFIIIRPSFLLLIKFIKKYNINYESL